MTATAEHLILDNIVKKALDSNNDDLPLDPTRPGSNGIDKNNGNCPLTTNKHLANHCNDTVSEPTALGKSCIDVKLNGDIEDNNDNTESGEGGNSPKEVSCGKCAQKFTSLQRYMEHSCTTMPLILSNHVDGEEPFSGDDSSELSDIENFEGDIVYNPDGSAFLVDSSNKNSNQGPKDGQNAEAQPVKDNVPSVFPGIVNSLHIPAYMTGMPFGMGMQGPYTTPIVHSFRVYDVRSGKSGTKGEANDKDGKSSGKLELEQRGSGEGNVQAHGKPILMCFLCKLSFGFTKSFIAHASNEHKMSLNEEEKKIMAGKTQSAIIQGLGKEKNPLISFLEPSGAAKPQSTTSLANLKPPNNFLQSVYTSSSPTSVSYMLPASTISTSTPQSTGHISTSHASPLTQGSMQNLTSTHSSSGRSATLTETNSTAKQSDLSNSTEQLTAEKSSLPVKSDLVNEGDKSKGPSDKESVDQTEPKSSTHRTEIAPLDHRPYLSDSKSALKLETKDSERLAKEGSALIDGIEARIQHALNQDSGHDDLEDNNPPMADDSNLKAERSTPSASPFMDERSRGTPASVSSQDMMHETVCSSHGGTNIGDHHHHHHNHDRNSSSVECPKCDMVLGSSRSLGGHMTMMHSRNSCKTLKCPKCNWHYKYQQTLEAHMKEKHPENETKCVYCETNQPHPRLSRGETYTCGYKPYRCEVCNYSTTTKGNLSIHMQSDKHLNNVQELQNGGEHMFLQTKLPHHHSHPSHHQHAQDAAAANKSKPKHTWRCDVCDYETNVARNLRIHMTSEKHIHNMMAIQQNVSQMQQEMQTNLANYQAEEPMYMYLAQNMLPMMAAGAATTPEGMEMSMMANYGQYDPVTYAALMGNMAMGMNAGPDAPDQPTGPEDPAFNEPLKLYQCSVCNKFSADDLEALQDHVHHRDRSQPNEQLWRLVLGDVQQCALCNYTTQVKANFQLHMKTDKHQQKLQLFNHIREGGKQNEWRLKYMNVGNPIQVRCNACDYYTYSVDKLQGHAHPGNYRHETSMKLFRHLQKINITVNSESRRFRCPLCNYSTKAKLNLIQHVQSLQHIKNEERMLLKRSAPEVPSTSADPASSEGALDLSKKDKPSPPIRDSPELKSEGGEAPAKKHRVTEPNAASRVKLESRSPNTTQIFTCPYCKYSSIDQQRITAHVMSQHSIKPTPILRCPLCQEVCTNKINLEVHLMEVHSVSRDCIQGLMLTVDANPNPEFSMLPGGIPGGVTAAASQLQASAAAVPPTYMTSNPAMEALAQAGMKSPNSALEAASTASLQNAEAINVDAADRARDSPASDIDNSDLYRCQKCHQNFANIDQLYAHQNKVCPLTEQDTPGGPGFLCWKKGCNQYFKTASALQMHFKEIHAKRQQTSVSDRHLYKFRCTQCSLAFKTEEKLQNHMQYHLLRAATKCPICQRTFRSISGLESHIETNHQGFSKTELLQLYNPVQNGDIPGIAPFSGVKDETSSENPEGSEADSQMSNDLGDKDDNASSVDDDTMDEFSQSDFPVPDEASYMDPNNKYKCHRCRVGFVKQTDLSSHNKTLQHRKGDKSSQAFSLQKYWDPNRPYKCDVCKESFTQKNILLVHYNSVSHLHKLKQSLSETSEQDARSDAGDDKPYKCTLCKVSYSQAATLDTHMRSVLHQSRAAKQESSSSAAPAAAVPEKEEEREKGTTEQSIINTIIENGLAGNPTSAQQLLSQAMQAQEAQVQQYQQMQLQQLQQLQLQQLQQAHLQHHSQLQQAQAYLQQQATSGQMDLNSALQMELALAQLAGYPTHMMYQNHMSTAPPNVFACNQCASVFVSQEALTQHQQTSCGATKAEAQAQAAAAQQEQERARSQSQQQQQPQQEQPPQSESPPTPVSPSCIQKPMLVEGSKRIKKSQVQRKLLEGYGFDLVQQFNESRQGLPASIAAEDKIPCQHCRRQFSSIFVYKAHLEEHHKKILPNDEIEKYSKKFMDVLIEAASQGGEEKETTDETDQDEMEQEKAELEHELLEQEKKEKETEKEKEKEEKEEVVAPPKSETPMSQVSTEDSASTTSAAQLTASQILQQAQHGTTPATTSSSQVMPPPPSPQMFMANPFPFSMMQTPGGIPGYPSVPVHPMQAPVASSATATASIPAMQAVQYIDPNYMQKSTKRARTRISDDQLKILRAYFDINNSPTEEQIAEMSDKSGLPHKVIKHWFRNTLFKERQRNKDSPYNFNNPPTTSLLDAKKEKGDRPVSSPSPSLSSLSEEKGPVSTVAAVAAASAAAAAAAAAAQAATKDPIQKIKNEPRTPSSTPPPQSISSKSHPHEPTRSASTPTTSSSATPPPKIPHLAPAETAEEIIRVAERKAREARARWEGKTTLGPNEVDHIVRTAEHNAQRAREAWEMKNQLKRPTGMDSPSFHEKQAKDVADKIAEKLAIPRPEMNLEKKVENKPEVRPENRNGGELPAQSTVTSAPSSESKHKSSIPPPICTTVAAPTTPTTSSPTTPTSASGMSDFSSPLMSPISPVPGMGNTSTPSSSSRRSGRTRFTDYQIKVLQEFFENNAYPKDDDLDHLSRLLNLSPRVIVVWFQNARQKARKIFENQPLRESELDSTGNTRYKRTPGLNYQCNKCLLVFQRFYELIRHQKQHCFKDDESLQQSTSQISPPLRIGSESSQGSSTRPASESSTSSKEERPVKTEPEVKSEKRDGRRDEGPVVHYQCEQCSLVFPHFKQWQEHQQVHMMSMGLFGSPYMSPQQMPSPYNMMYMPFEAMNGMTQEQYLQYMKAATGQAPPEASPSKTRTVSEASDDTAVSASENSDNTDAGSKDKRLRTTISPAQLDILYAKYQEDSNPTRRMLDMISKEVGLKKRVVQVWFQNTRARERKGQFRLSAPNQTRKCPFCRALFKARTALEAHIKMRHFDQQLTPAQLEAILSQPPTPGDGTLPPQSPDQFTKPQMAGDYGMFGRRPEEWVYDDTSRDSFQSQDGKRDQDTESPTKQRLLSEESKDSGNSSAELVRPPLFEHKQSSPEKARPENGPTSESSRTPENKMVDLQARDKAPSRPGSTAGSDASQQQVEGNMDDTVNSMSRESDMMSPTSSTMGDDTFENTPSEAGSVGPSEDSLSNMDEAERRREANKRYRTQMSQLQLKVLKHCFTDYRTPTMHECELLGQEIGLPKRVIQVWFQNARAKDKKSNTKVTKHFGMIGSSSEGQPEMCRLCNVKYSMTLSVRDHVFTEMHIHNVKKHINSTIEKETGENSSLILPMTGAGEAKQPPQTPEQASQGPSPGQQYLADPQAQALLQQSMMNPMAAAQMQALQAMGAAHMLPPQMAAAAAAGMMPTPPPAAAGKPEGDKGGEKKEKDKKEDDEAQRLAQAQQAAAMAQMSHQDAALMQYLYGGMAPYYAQMQMMYPMYAMGGAMGQEALLAYDQAALRGGQVPPHVLQAYAAANPLAAAQLQGLTAAGAKPGEPSASSSPKPGSSSKSDPRAISKDKFIMWPNSSANRYLCRKCERVFTDRDSVTSHQLSSCYLGQVVNIEETVDKLPTNRFLCQVCPREALITEEDVHRHLQTPQHEKKAARHRPLSSSSSRSSKASSSSSSDKS